ncbi:hypothetical protein COLO4_34139 [Corchorus olitorius]|uniref:Myb/SANT-like domain-containing protein n=1 Tax=Corchorus olitorius TaxID=93759 RepID=A0A1R3GNF8_9ROSI|nr:hypothetical protein COLO4_34139 [Corchorus olitorius]
MGGRGKEVEDAKDWSKVNEDPLIQLLIGKVREGKFQSSTFKKKVWSETNDELREVIGEDYDFRRFKKQGCAEYELLGEIFDRRTATGKLQQLSTEDPLSDTQQRRLEEEFLSGSLHVDLDTENSEVEGDQRGKKRGSDSSDRRNVNCSKTYKMDAFLDKWTATLTAREEAYKAKADRYKSSSSSGSVNPHSKNLRSSKTPKYNLNFLVVDDLPRLIFLSAERRRALGFLWDRRTCQGFRNLVPLAVGVLKLLLSVSEIPRTAVALTLHSFLVGYSRKSGGVGHGRFRR